MIYYEPFTNFEIVAKQTYIKETEDDGKLTVVTIKAPNGKKYRGITKIAAEDMNYFRPLTGYKIAENRAYIAYLKRTVAILQLERTQLRDILRVQEYLKTPVYSNKEERNIRYKIKELTKEIKAGKITIAETYKLISAMIDERWKVIDKIEHRNQLNQRRQEIVDAIRAGQNS